MTSNPMYHNRFDPNKGYKQVLVIDDRYIQGAELNEMQSYQHHDMKLFAGAVFGDGAILEGGEIKKVGENAKIEKATIYSNGYGVPLSSISIPISPIDTIIIGSAIKQEIVTAKEDPTLLNPAIGTAGFKSVGAERLKVTGRWCSEDDIKEGEAFYPAFTFIDGILQSVKRIAPELDGARKIVARYDHHANGNYVVDGLVPTFDRDDDLDQEHIITISEGNGHVEGQELIFDYAQKVRVPFALDKREIVAEPNVFKGNGEYTVRHNPIASIDRIVGIVETTESITHGSYRGIKDILPNTPVVEVLEIKQGDTIYKNGTDWVQNGDFVDWSPLGNEPSPSSTYTVVYRYQTHIEDVQYNSNAFTLEGLAENTSFYINYSYYLSRVDKIILTRNGSFEVLRGVADEYSPVAPNHAIGLSLAEVTVSFGQEPSLKVNFVKTFKADDIQRMYERMEALEYNVGKIELLNNARSIDPTLNTRELFVDPFYDDDLRDMGIEQDAVIAEKELHPNIDFTQHEFSFDVDISLPYQNNGVLIEQRKNSGGRLINEYIEADTPLNSISVTPSTFRWIARTVVYSSSWSSGSMVSVSSSSAIVPPTRLRIQAKTFDDTQVDVVVDDRHVGTLDTIQIEESRYRVDGYITTPVGLRSGNKLIKVIGKTTGITVEYIWSAVPLQRTIIRRIRWRDPLAQTILFTQDRFVAELELNIIEKPTTYVTLTVCKTTAGMPDLQQTIYSKNYEVDSLTIGWNTFKFDVPVLFESDVEYALVIESGDAIGKVATARLGAYDLESNDWITHQPYEGVLLSSANSSTWTAYQKEDLSLVVHKPMFDENMIKEIGRVNVEDITDLFLMAINSLYVGTNIKFIANLVDANKEVLISPFNLTSIETYTGEIILSAIFTTTDRDVTPILDKDVVLGIGQVKNSSTYVSREFSLSASNLDVYLDLNSTPDGVKVYAEINSEFVELDIDRDKSRHIGDGWVETCFKKDDMGVSKTRIKIVLISKDTIRPRVKNLRGIVS